MFVRTRDMVFIVLALLLSSSTRPLASGAEGARGGDTPAKGTAAADPPDDARDKLETATFAGGCFWCTEAIFADLRGVKSVISGYAGGHVVNPTYKQVCTGSTGHAEAIQITFDPKQIRFHDLLLVFFATHDPTTLNRQGADVGTQYRSAIFYHGDEQRKAAEEVKQEAQKDFSSPIVTEIVPFTNFYKAEDYHQEYYELNGSQPYCRMVIAPKLEKFRKKFRDKLKQP